MVSDAAYRIVPLSPETWPAFEALIQRHNGIFGGCWCTWFHDGHPSCVGRGETFDGNRAIKKRLVDEGVARAALRSEERRVGKECRPLCRSRWSPYH